MTDKTELLALLKRAMDKLDCYYKHTAGEYPGGEPNQNLFPAIREALAEQPAGAVAEVVDVCGTGVKVPAWIGTGPAPDIPTGTKLYVGIPPAASVDVSENAEVVEELDALLATQARLLFARENYSATEAESYGVRLLDFFRKHGLELRAALVSHNTEAKPTREAGSA